MSSMLASGRIRSLLAKVPSDTINLNKGALYVAASRGMASEVGSGSGKGGGSGGSIREAGGAMGKKGAALEEQYFSKQSKELKDKMKDHLKDEIKKHEEAIKAKKDLMKDLDK